MKTNNIIEKDGKIYNNVAVTLSITPIFFDGDIGGSISMRCTPYNDNKQKLVSENPTEKIDRILYIPDIYKEKDPDVQVALYKISEAIQELILAKNL